MTGDRDVVALGATQSLCPVCLERIPAERVAVHEDVYLLATKAAAIAHCAEQRLGVILVPTVVPGVNTDQLASILGYALERAPAVRGVHFQPVSFFGRYPSPPSDLDRITIPEVMRALERQTGGAIEVSHFRPPSAENAHCSFQGSFLRSKALGGVPDASRHAAQLSLDALAVAVRSDQKGSP